MSRQVILSLIRDITELIREEESVSGSQDHFINILDSLPIGVFIKDQDNHVIFANDYLEANFGLDANRTETLEMLIVGEDEKPNNTKDLGNNNGNLNIVEKRVIDLKGGEHFLEIYDFSIRDQNDPSLRGGIVVDITKHKRLEKKLRESEQQYSLAIRGTNDGIWDWDLKNKMIHYSPRWKSMLGYEEAQISNNPNEWFSRIHSDDIEQVKKDIDNHLRGITPHFESEHRILKGHDNGYGWYLVRGRAILDVNKRASRISGTITDITLWKENEERLRHDAMHDPLTKLPNRLYLMHQLQYIIERVHRHDGYQAALLFMDIDRFKIVNDRLGHTAGDELLIVISRRLKKSLRSEDMIARFGGDEFAVLVGGVSGNNEVKLVAQRLLEELSLPIRLHGQEISLTVSIGITMVTRIFQSAEDLLRDVDIAMYQAKSKGRARYEFLSYDINKTILPSQMESEIRRAIERNEFLIHYQPIVTLATGEIVGLEALIRWQHPSRGLIMPGEFIPLAEENGLIIQIGDWVLWNACAQIKRWHDSGFHNIVVSINISARQLQTLELPNLIKKIINDIGINGTFIQLEISERVFTRDNENVMQVLKQLMTMGLKIVIDDFGSGNSSLGYLERLPVRNIKIDYALIRDISKDKGEITAALIVKAHTLDIKVVAEGVEKIEQLNFLVSHQCDQIQGYIISQCLSAEEMTRLLPKKTITIPSGSYTSVN